MDKSYSKILLQVNKLQDFIYLFEGRILLLPVEGTVLSSSLGIALDVPDMHVDSMGGRYISHRSNSVFVQCETTIISDTEISVVVGYYYDLIKIFKDGKVCPGYSIVDQYIIQFVNTLDYIKMYTWGGLSNGFIVRLYIKNCKYWYLGRYWYKWGFLYEFR